MLTERTVPAGPPVPASGVVRPYRGSGVELEYRGSGGATLGYLRYAGQYRSDVALVYLHGIESHAGWFGLMAEQLRGQSLDAY